MRRLNFARLDGGDPGVLEADCLLISGGYSPATALASHVGASQVWQPSIAAYTPVLDPRFGRVAGAARGCRGLAAAALDGAAAAASIAAELGLAVGPVEPAQDLPPDPELTPMVRCGRSAAAARPSSICKTT